MGIYTGFGLESMIQLLLEGEVLWMYGLILPAVLAISRFGILWTANSNTPARFIGKIGNNELNYNLVSLYIGIDHPDIHYSNLGLTIINDIANTTLNVKTWCNALNSYFDCGIMLGCNLNDQGNGNIASGNYTNDLNGIIIKSPPSVSTTIYTNGSPFQIINSLTLTLIYQFINNTQNFISQPIATSNQCDPNLPSYRNENNQLVDKSKVNTINIFPIPFSNFFNIQSFQPIYAFELMDMQGKIVLKECELFQQMISVNLNVTSGFYHLKLIHFDGSISYHKLIKAKD